MKPIYRIFWRSGGWIAILFVWLGLIIAASGVLTLQNATHLAANGVTTTAQITNKTAQDTTEEASRIDYFVEYTLATPNGTFAGQAKVNREYYFSVSEGEVVSLRYLAETPEVHELYDGDLKRSGQATSVVGAGFTGLGLLITLGFGLIARQGAGLLASGAKVQATVHAKSSFVLISRLKFDFKLPDGRTETGKSFWRFARAHKGIMPRDLIEVRYNNAQTSTSFWFDDLTQRK